MSKPIYVTLPYLLSFVGAAKGKTRPHISLVMC